MLCAIEAISRKWGDYKVGQRGLKKEILTYPTRT